MKIIQNSYFKELQKRKKSARIHRRYQATGLALAQILEDDKHKSLYMKLAKERDNDKLIALAKDVAERKNVKNKGAYFMRLLGNIGQRYGKQDYYNQ